MEINTLIKDYQRRSGAAMAIILIFLLIGSALTFSQPLKYRSKSRLLIVQDISADPYTVSRSNQYLSNLFSEIIYSGSFFDLAANNDSFDIDKNYFSGNYKKQMESWKKSVEAKSIGDSGILEISVYHQNPAQAKQISLAINSTLMNQSFNYQGDSQQRTDFRVIDQPIISDYPVKPNVIANLLASLILGFIFSLIYIYLFPDKKQKLIVKKKERVLAERHPDYQASISLVDEKEDGSQKITLKEEYYRPEPSIRPPFDLDEQDDESEEKEGFQFDGNMKNILK